MPRFSLGFAILLASFRKSVPRSSSRASPFARFRSKARKRSYGNPGRAKIYFARFCGHFERSARLSCAIVTTNAHDRAMGWCADEPRCTAGYQRARFAAGRRPAEVLARSEGATEERGSSTCGETGKRARGCVGMREGAFGCARVHDCGAASSRQRGLGSSEEAASQNFPKLPVLAENRDVLSGARTGSRW